MGVITLEQAYKMLYLLAAGFKKWEENREIIPEEIYKGMKLLVKERAKNNLEPVVDLNHLVKLLTLPSKEWGVGGVEQFFPEEASLLDIEIGVTYEAEDLLAEYPTLDEYELSVMKKILIYCRDNHLEEEYRKIRTFFSSPDHAVIPFLKLHVFFGELQDDQLIQFVSLCYEEVTNIAIYRKCPICGWTLERKNGHWRCNKENVCHFLGDFNYLLPFEDTGERILRLKPSIQKYVLLPGMAEQRIAERLEAKGFQVNMYPNIDEYDIQAVSGETVFCLDVKDYKHPSQLASYLNRKPISEIGPNLFYVIPDYRERSHRQYTKRVMQKLKNERKEIVKVISEKELLKIIQRGTDHEKGSQ